MPGKSFLLLRLCAGDEPPAQQARARRLRNGWERGDHRSACRGVGTGCIGDDLDPTTPREVVQGDVLDLQPQANRERIINAVELGLSNSKLEGLNSKIRLINHRGYGHHTPAALIAMIYLCCGGITVQLPTQR